MRKVLCLNLPHTHTQMVRIVPYVPYEDKWFSSEGESTNKWILVYES